MRPTVALRATEADAASSAGRSDWATLRKLLPYLWRYRWRVGFALAFMLIAKFANVGVPLLLKALVDGLSVPPGGAVAMLVVPVGLLMAYGALRLSTTVFAELRELVFAKATEGTARSISLQVFRHLHALSLRFHLERQTGGMSRDIERGTRAVHSLISFSLYSVLPTLVEVVLVLTILAVKFDAGFAWITGVAVVLYAIFTVSVTEWRTKFRLQMNEYDSRAHSKAIDALLNYETVKYFNNEDFETRRYDESLEQLRRAALKSKTSLSLLNAGQQLIIVVALVAILWRATQGVVAGTMTLGDLVMVNAFMIQLYIPLGFLGTLYREIKQSLTDLDKMFVLLARHREVDDAPDAADLQVRDGSVRFENVSFAYDPARPILHDVSFEIPPRQDRGGGRAVGGGQVHAGAAAVPLLRRVGRGHHDRRAGHPQGHADQRAAGHRHRAAGHRAVQRHGGIQHRLRPAGRQPRGGRGRRARGAYPRFHRRHASGLRHHGGRARPQAEWRREAACGDRAHPAQEPPDPDLRRGHLGAGLRQRARDPGRAEERVGRQDHARHRAPAVHRGGRAPHRRAGPGPHRRDGHPRRPARAQRAVRGDVAAAAQRP
jgi:hypothetical protein